MGDLDRADLAVDLGELAVHINILFSRRHDASITRELLSSLSPSATTIAPADADGMLDQIHAVAAHIIAAVTQAALRASLGVLKFVVFALDNTRS